MIKSNCTKNILVRTTETTLGQTFKKYFYQAKKLTTTSFITKVII